METIAAALELTTEPLSSEMTEQVAVFDGGSDSRCLASSTSGLITVNARHLPSGTDNVPESPGLLCDKPAEQTSTLEESMIEGSEATLLPQNTDWVVSSLTNSPRIKDTFYAHAMPVDYSKRHNFLLYGTSCVSMIKFYRC